ncbi:hypothetical protein CSB69_2362 [Morganella morganii]|nr:hypothetical protein CSB69_2362 [Morganella morganii]
MNTQHKILFTLVYKFRLFIICDYTLNCCYFIQTGLNIE